MVGKCWCAYSSHTDDSVRPFACCPRRETVPAVAHCSIDGGRVYADTIRLRIVIIVQKLTTNVGRGASESRPVQRERKRNGSPFLSVKKSLNAELRTSKRGDLLFHFLSSERMTSSATMCSAAVRKTEGGRGKGYSWGGGPSADDGQRGHGWQQRAQALSLLSLFLNREA